ncbi:MAG: sensor domain-containing protein [Ktedonobacteraceae bacterium]|nr:sensor domain-containing protein [Ktedonobacteraceae bacterium]
MRDYGYTTQNSTMAGNIVFLLLAFPLGLLYFLVVIIGFSVGVSTLVVWIGLPILFATVVLIHGMATIERYMVTNLLRLPLNYRVRQHEEEARGFLRRFGRILRDPFTWTGMIYMLLKLPLGIISFTLALVLSITSIAITFLPVAYLVNLLVNLILLKNGIQSNAEIIPYFIEVRGHFDLVMFARSFIGVPVGLAFWVLTRFLLNGLAHLSGELAHAMLGPGDMDMSARSEQGWPLPLSFSNQHASYEEQNASQEARGAERYWESRQV